MTTERVGRPALLLLSCFALTPTMAAATEGTAFRARAAAPAAKSPLPPVGPESDGSCLAALRAVYGDRIRPVSATIGPPANPDCRIVDPVLVEAVAIDGVAITLTPPATLSCAMAGKVAIWLKTSVRPLTRGYFAAELSDLRVGGGQECRRRNRAASGPLSEHATGRALDIFAFETGGPDVQRIVVEKPDGPRQRDYLLALRQSACGGFSTSLGPGADQAHANHLHLDIQMRRSPASKFCE